MNINVNHIIILLYVHIVCIYYCIYDKINININLIQNRFLLPSNSKNSFRKISINFYINRIYITLSSIARTHRTSTFLFY